MTAAVQDRDGRLDVVVRFHDPARLGELERCVLSLVGQRHRPLHVHVVLQRFPAAERAEVASRLAPLFAIAGAPGHTIHDFEAAEPRDARSALMNMGLAAGGGRYGAFLDYDDALYPEAYSLLIGRLRRSHAARIAFGGILVKRLRVYEHAVFAEGKERPFVGRTVLDLFAGNFCPIHSFVFDRDRIPAEEIRFEEGLVRAEDYDFLLRVCSGGMADFGLIDTVVGEYYWKSDGSNTVLTTASYSDAGQRAWLAAEDFLEWRRRTTEVAPEVQLAAGLEHAEQGLAVRDLLNRLGRPGAGHVWPQVPAD